MNAMIGRGLGNAGLALFLLAMAAPARAETAAAALPPDLMALHAARGEACDPLDEVPEPPYAYALGSGQTLYLVPCTAGAYRRFYSVYLAGNGGYEALWFAGLTYGAGWQAEPGVWLDRFDPGTGQLHSLDLGSSLGDCGRRGVWQGTGRLFAMIEYRMKRDCDRQGEPGDFPVVFAAEGAGG